MLGVVPMDNADMDDDLCPRDDVIDEAAEQVAETDTDQLSGDELFLAAMQDLDVHFTEPDYQAEASAKVEPVPRRMKQLRQGRIVPEASLDLHGLTRAEVAPKLKHFIQDARYHGWQTLLIITGQGLHSEGGEAVLRGETEEVLKGIGKGEVAEWGRAPHKFGGAGAIVVFLKNKS